MKVINDISDDNVEDRIKNLDLPTRSGLKTTAPVFKDAYLVYEAQFVRPQNDFTGMPIFESYSRDLGSHKVYFFEITTIQIEKSIAEGEKKIHWCSLPFWEGANSPNDVQSNNVIK